MSGIQEQIKQVWEAEQEILDVIDDVCRRHGLRYTLAYGTLIGAVRHGGFIPWDDDIDIMMPREDYEKLLFVWQKDAPSNYILQNIRTNPDYTNTFSKIRKDHTTFLQDEEEAEKSYHKGIFVDIFPADRVAGGNFSRKLQGFACAVYLLYTRGYTSGSGGFKGLLERFLLRLPKGMRASLRKKCQKRIRKYNGNNDLLWFAPSTMGSSKIFYSSALFDKMKEIEFCGKKYSCVEDHHGFLTGEYGDYMQLPPESERVWKHHPIIIDFDHNYEELERDEKK